MLNTEVNHSAHKAKNNWGSKEMEKEGWEERKQEVLRTPLNMQIINIFPKSYFM